MRILAAAIVIGVTASGGALAQEDPGSPYVQAFCGLRDIENGAGRFHLLSPSLAEVVRTSLERNAAIQAEHPDEKPPLGDGVPYQSMQDYAPVCEPGGSVGEGDAVIATVNYRFPDAPDAGWSDRLVLTEGEGGALYIDDIRYGETGDQTLRGTLSDAFVD